MSQIVYRGNLSAKVFPFLSDFHGRTVIVPGQDNTFNYQLSSDVDTDRDVGVPTMYYCHNVLPAPYGFNAIGYETLSSYAVEGFSEIKLIRTNPVSPTVEGPRIYFAPFLNPTDYGAHKVFANPAGNWTTILNPITVTASTVVSYATVQGITYIFFSNIGCYKYDAASNTLIAVTLTGMVASNILGIASYQGYMIAYDVSSIYWSSVIDIDYTLNSVDFVPSLTTGAGQIKPEGTKGPITFVMPATFGLAIYTSSNIVSAVYSGNSRFPFNFKEIVSSGGCQSPTLVAYDANTGNQYAYTTSGVQTVTATATQTVFSDVTDFLAGADFEDFDQTTFTFTETKLTNPMLKQITSVADRYLIYSYGITSYTHAIVYDMAQKRYGKFKVDHVACFEYEYIDQPFADAPRRSIAFLKLNGSIEIVNPSVNFSGSNGVILLGKFQYVRSRLITLEGIELQNIHSTQSASVYDMYSMDGGTVRTLQRVQGYETSAAGQSQRTYKFHKTAMNHSLLLVGGFFLASFILTFHIHGRR